MGRELRRVPLDFDWPIDKVWGGYLSPTRRTCPDCYAGASPDLQWVEVVAVVINLLGECGASGKPLHPWVASIGHRPAAPPTAAWAEVSGGMAGRPPRSPFGHDGIDRWATTAALLKAAGLDKRWGVCPTCNGDAVHPEDAHLADGWEPTEPPEGEGYQLWETTSEGSPQTPVFATLDALCEYAAIHCTVFADNKVSAAEWKRMLDDGFVALDMRASDGTRVTFI